MYLRAFEINSMSKCPQHLHVLNLNGENLYIGVEVARILQYAHPRSTIGDLDPRYKITIYKPMITDQRLQATLFPEPRAQKITLLTERGLLHLLMRSRFPGARRIAETWLEHGPEEGLRELCEYG